MCDKGSSVHWLVGDDGGAVFGQGHCTPEEQTDEETGSSSLYSRWGSAGKAHIPLSIKQQSWKLKAFSILLAWAFRSQTSLRRISNPIKVEGNQHLGTFTSCPELVKRVATAAFSCLFSLSRSSPCTVYYSLLVIFLYKLQHADTGVWFTHGDSDILLKENDLAF